MRYFAVHKEVAGVAEEVVEVPDGTTVRLLMDELVRLHPEMKALERDTVVSVNRGVGPYDIVLKAGDDVALLPPISGG